MRMLLRTSRLVLCVVAAYVMLCCGFRQIPISGMMDGVMSAVNMPLSVRPRLA